MEAKKEAKKKRKHPLYSFFFISFWVIIAVMFTGLIITQATRYNELRAELSRVNANIAIEQAFIEDLNMQMLFFDSDAHVEQLARERLGMVRQNEIVFVNIAGD